MHFLFLHHADPLSEKVWAGIPLHITRTLETAGHQISVIKNLEPKTTPVARVKKRLSWIVQKKIYDVHRDPKVAKRRALWADEKIRKVEPLDAILISDFGDSAYLETDVPIIAIKDATWAQLLDYYPGYERKNLRAETIEGGIYLDKLGLRRCAHAIYSSSWAANSAIRDCQADPSKLSVCRFGANFENPPSRGDLSRFLRRRGKNRCKLLFIGKQWYRKGGDRAVSIAEAVQNRGVDVELHVVGTEPEGQIPDFLVPHGPLWKKTEDDLRKLLGLFEESDFFILPTRADCSPIVFCEAAVYGLPVITCDTGGVKETVRGGWGLVLPPNSPATDYADWIVRNFTDRGEYERLAWLARGAFESDLNWRVMAEHIVAVAEDVRRVQSLA